MVYATTRELEDMRSYINQFKKIKNVAVYNRNTNEIVYTEDNNPSSPWYTIRDVKFFGIAIARKKITVHTPT